MRILFTPAPFKAHLYVQVPLAWALRTAGHDVRVAASPDLAEDIARTGLVGVSVGQPVHLDRQMAGAEPPRPLVDPTARPEPKSVQTDFGRDDPHGELESNVMGWKTLFNPPSAFDDLVDFAQDWRPDLVVSDTFVFTGAVAARVSGAAHARMLFGADGLAQLRSACRAHGGPTAERQDPIRDWLHPILDRFGHGFDEEVVIGQWTVFPMPSWIWRPAGVNYLPMRHLPFNGPARTPEWLREKPRRPRVCMTFGLSHRDGGFGVTASAQELFAAVADLDVEVVATFNNKQLETVTEVPDNVRLVDFVPLNLLLPSCSAVVHSGGAGTFAAALENGVPQLIIPNVYWSEKWWGPVVMANGVESRGAGVYVSDADQLTADGLRKHLVRVMEDPSYADNAAQLRREVTGMPTPNDVVPLLERMTVAHRPAR
ncbi:activator-dependent family glycosyltransferase [Nocardiopsis ansamitocini]|uniref:Glycosyl transferase n=1 Tax=Nocardiopsis ansamitocini TaxID=1670832 RepID=A0A9W6P810_9ACTN|nr:activator-dependent family glycosyltransferase [Nocardiopsis ansamitocini]GLU48711.1 glycosyl transferase [Nocardiopsis ansamitocini]